MLESMRDLTESQQRGRGMKDIIIIEGRKEEEEEEDEGR